MDLLLPLLVSLLIFSAAALLIWACFVSRWFPSPPVKSQIAMAMGLGNRKTVFEAPVFGQLLGFALMLARRFRSSARRSARTSKPAATPAGTPSTNSSPCASRRRSSRRSWRSVFGDLGQFALLALVVLPVLGFAGPLYSLHEAARSRVRKIAKKLPYTLDLVALMMESGAMFTESIETIVQDEPDDELNRELALVQSEIEFGTTRAVSLANLADRIPLETLRSVVGAINQAEALGTPLSTILKNQSGMIRLMRTVRAEEASASASMKILIPGTLILIAVVLMFFGPIIMRMYHGNMLAP